MIWGCREQGDTHVVSSTWTLHVIIIKICWQVAPTWSKTKDGSSRLVCAEGESGWYALHELKEGRWKLYSCSFDVWCRETLCRQRVKGHRRGRGAFRWIMQRWICNSIIRVINQWVYNHKTSSVVLFLFIYLTLCLQLQYSCHSSMFQCHYCKVRPVLSSEGAFCTKVTIWRWSYCHSFSLHQVECFHLPCLQKICC